MRTFPFLLTCRAPLISSSEMIFRKSDVEWLGTSRGWELMLSYSFRTRITSGYIKAMNTYGFKDILETLQGCGGPTSHPLLLPVLILCKELSATNDEAQREQRRRLRALEVRLTQRYQVEPAAGYGPETDPELDDISRQLADCQCKVLQKRPQAWATVVKEAQSALACFWERLPDGHKRPELQNLHETLESRLEFLSVKLEGLGNYAYVTLERLNIHREVASQDSFDHSPTRLLIFGAVSFTTSSTNENRD